MKDVEGDVVLYKPTVTSWQVVSTEQLPNTPLLLLPSSLG